MWTNINHPEIAEGIQPGFILTQDPDLPRTSCTVEAVTATYIKVSRAAKDKNSIILYNDVISGKWWVEGSWTLSIPD